MEIKLDALEAFTLPDLEGKFLVVDTHSDGYTGTVAGHYNYDVEIKDGEYFVYPTLWNNALNAFVRTDETVVYTQGDNVYYSANTNVDPYTHVDIRTLVVEAGMEKPKRVIQAFKYFADDLFSFGNYNLFVNEGISQAVDPSFVAVTGVTLDNTSLEIELDTPTQLTATVAPENATNKTITWKSNNTNLTVSATGLVNATVAGTYVVTVQTADGDFTATCNVVAKPATIPLTELKVSPKIVELAYGETANITVTPLPADATDKSYKVFLIGEELEGLTFSKDGTKITAGNKYGTTTIGYHADGIGEPVTVTVKVLDPRPANPITSWSVTPATLNMKVGETHTVDPENDFTVEPPEWKPWVKVTSLSVAGGNPSDFATVTGNVITAKKAGGGAIGCSLEHKEGAGLAHNSRGTFNVTVTEPEPVEPTE